MNGFLFLPGKHGKCAPIFIKDPCILLYSRSSICVSVCVPMSWEPNVPTRIPAHFDLVGTVFGMIFINHTE